MTRTTTTVGTATTTDAWARRAIAAAALAMAAIPAAGAAEPAAGEGVGTYTCAEFQRASKADESREMLYFSWAQGWMTAWNLAQMDASKPFADLSTPPIDDQRAFIRTYCSQHGASLYMEAVYRLYASMKTSAR